MVKKLLKHEFMYYFRTFGMFLPIVLAIGVVTRIFILVGNGSVISDLAIGSSVLMLVVACVALVILSYVVSIVRFYKNMYSSEGYLTFTLPVTNAQHIFVKLLAAIVCEAICVVTVIAAVAIAISGEPLAELVRELGNALREFFYLYGAGNAIVFIIEAIVLFILSAVSGTLLYYACITVGQMAKKNRILMAFGAYFVYYVATQMLSTAFVIIIMILETSGALDAIEAWLSANSVIAIHIYLCGAIVIGTALAAAYWLVTQHIMTKKLNLE